MILDLVLNNYWYGEIESGDTTLEYRQITPHWTKRIWDRRDEITHVNFRKGYSKISMKKKVTKIEVGTYPNSNSPTIYYLIHFKED